MKTYEDLKTYFSESEKRPDQRTIGGEFEHLILDQDNRWTPYETVCTILEEILDEEWTRIVIDGKLLGAQHQYMAISLEPGSQFEVSLQPSWDIAVLEERYRIFLNKVLPIIHRHGRKLVSIGYQPFTPIENISMIDKKRYHYMYEYFKNTGSLAHHMMKGSCSTQVAIDFTSEEDFRRAYQLGNRIGPFLALMFDNTPLFEGRPFRDYLWRTTIWQNTDDMRCNLVKQGLDPAFGYRQYIDHILDFEPILMPQGENMVPTYQLKSRELLHFPVPKTVWEHLLSMAFFDIRAKSYLEVRMMDCVPYPFNMANLAMIKGIMYHPERHLLEASFASIDESKLLDIKNTIMKEGYTAQCHGFDAHATVKRLFEFAWSGLSDAEKVYLEPMRPFVDQGVNFTSKLRFLKAEEIIDFCEVKLA